MSCRCGNHSTQVCYEQQLLQRARQLGGLRHHWMEPMVRLHARQLFDVWPVLMCLYRRSLYENDGPPARLMPAQLSRSFTLA